MLVSDDLCKGPEGSSNLQLNLVESASGLVAKQSMAVASSRAGQVLARPLFRMHVRTLNTAREVVRSKPSRLKNKKKATAHHMHRTNFTDKMVTLR